MNDDEARKQMSKEFLLAEFAALQTRFSDYESLKASRVNFLLIIVAAVVAAVPAVADRLGPYVGEAAFITGVVALLLGITTLFRVVVVAGSVFLVQLTTLVLIAIGVAGFVVAWFAQIIWLQRVTCAAAAAGVAPTRARGRAWETRTRVCGLRGRLVPA